MYMEDRIEAPGAQPSPGLGTASNRLVSPPYQKAARWGPASPPTAGTFPSLAQVSPPTSLIKLL